MKISLPESGFGNVLPLRPSMITTSLIRTRAYRTTMWNFLGFGQLAGVCYDSHFLRCNRNLVPLDAEERS